ncbi:MAG TPA: hypothetical protein VMR80_09425 [Candidatus Acidoferrum sp.]|nr:hypothetical protein [Candidatus Acidoferrum sp.]
MVVVSAASSYRVQIQTKFSFGVLVLAATAILAGCGTTRSTPKPAPPQPGYPSVPPVPITWSPSTSPLPAPQAQVPPPPASNDFPLTVSSPTTGDSLTSPVTVVANANPKNPIFFMRVYVDQLAVYFTFTNSINTQIFVSPGQHTIEVMAEDNQGYISATPVSVTVTSQAQTTIGGIQNTPGWQSCGDLFPPGSGRAGQICAAGYGTPTSTIMQNVSSPSMDGQSAEFSISPALPQCPDYCNMLYFNPIAGGNNVTHFIYDLYFYIDDPSAPQALEFDLNQTFGGQRWTWGSECNFRADAHWDIWNGAPNTGWEATNIPCVPTMFQANAWNHLIWDVQRVGNNVQYNTLTLNGTVYPVNTTYPNQQDWTLEEIDTAFQMDLNATGQPYHVWLDKVNLTAY